MPVVCTDPKSVNFSVLEQLYMNENSRSLIKTKNEDDVTNPYKYSCFPKFLNSLMLDRNEIENNINWPNIVTIMSEPPPSKDLFNPKIPYSRSNINIMIWIISSIMSYRYHEDSEKIIHVINLLQFLLKVMTRLDRVHRKA